MFTQQLFELALNIQEPWYIKDIQFSAESKRLDIHIDFHKGAIFHFAYPVSRPYAGSYCQPDYWRIRLQDLGDTGTLCDSGLGRQRLQGS